MASSTTILPDELTPLETEPAAEVGKVRVDGEAAESFIAQKRIGERIKHLRLKKSMGLVDLGRHTGLSASFLSQLETGRVVPTLRNLARIAMVCSPSLGPARPWPRARRPAKDSRPPFLSSLAQKP